MSSQDYTVGWICAVTTEYIAACELLKKEYPSLSTASSHDSNAYTLGRVGDHRVVVACLPKGKYGIASAATMGEGHASLLRIDSPRADGGNRRGSVEQEA